MEEAPENGKESPHSSHANGMNEWKKLPSGTGKQQTAGTLDKANLFGTHSTGTRPNTAGE